MEGTLSMSQAKKIIEDALAPIFGVEIKDRSYRFKTYSRCFVGSEFVKWLIEKEHAASVE